MFISAPVDDWNSNTELAFPDDGECGHGRGDRGSICNRLLVRLLLPIQTLQRGRTDRHQRALPQLHVSQPDAHVLPKVSLLLPSSGHAMMLSPVPGFVRSSNQLGRTVWWRSTRTSAAPPSPVLQVSPSTLLCVSVSPGNA